MPLNLTASYQTPSMAFLKTSHKVILKVKVTRKKRKRKKRTVHRKEMATRNTQIPIQQFEDQSTLVLGPLPLITHKTHHSKALTATGSSRHRTT